MAHLGLLALGIFVGTLVCIAVRKTTNWSDGAKVIVSLLGAALSGVVFTFIQRVLGTNLGEALFMYPVGLAWSLLWLYAGQAMGNVGSGDAHVRIAGWLHIAGMILGTVLVLLLLMSEDLRNSLPRGS
jgi:hypothetical protein